MGLLLPFILCLFLTGCGTEPNTVLSAPLPVQDAYIETASKIASHEAFQVFPLTELGDKETIGIRTMGQDLLIFSDRDCTTLTRYSGDIVEPAVSHLFNFPLEPEDPSLVIGDDWISCYDPLEKQTLILDGFLEIQRRIPAPEGLVGKPILSESQSTLFYCTDSGIYAWNLEKDIHRCVKEMSFPSQALSGLFLNDTILQCSITETDKTRTLFLASGTGLTLGELEGVVSLAVEENRFYADFPVGFGQRYVFGPVNGEAQIFLPETAECTNFYLGSNAVTLSVTALGTLRLDYYDLSTGLHRNSLDLETGYYPQGFAGTEDGVVYFLSLDPDFGRPALCRWDPYEDVSEAENETLYTASYQLPGDEDSEALTQCQEYAERLSKTFGITILIGDEAAAIQPWDCDLIPETQPAVIWRELELLEQRLSQYPSHILPDTASHFTSLNLCIVRELSGTPESGNTAPATGIQFFHGTDAHVVISSGRFSEQALYHELFHAMETRILTESIAFDQWDALNPYDFAYTYGDTPEFPEEAYLSGSTRSFADPYSMTFPQEDRARIMEKAMLPGNHDLFYHTAMQLKLRKVCEGIREAYGLQKSTSVYPWEQYLKVPLSYAAQ